MYEAGLRYDWPGTPDLPPERLASSAGWVRHILGTDPRGGFVAVRGDTVVGFSLASRRGDLWFLSSLMVDTSMQGQGVGRRLLEAALSTYEGCRGGYLLGSKDPKALSRYGRAGFDLQPGHAARGDLDRSVLPVITGVRVGSYDDDRELVDEAMRTARGEPLGPDLAFLADRGGPLWVADGPTGRGFAVGRDKGVQLLAASTPAAAQALLWTCLAEATSPAVELNCLTGAQQWAVQVALAARLSLGFGPDLCTRGDIGPLWPYLPDGALG